jgi:hypothetical protein
METNRTWVWFCWGNSRTGNSSKEEISNVCWTVMVEMSGVCVCLLMALILQTGGSVGLWYLMTVMLCIPVFCSCSTSSVQAHWTTYCCARTYATGRRVCRYDTTCHISSSGSETNECRSDINVTVLIRFAVEILYTEIGVAEGCGLQAFDIAIGWTVGDARIVVLPSVESSSEKSLPWLLEPKDQIIAIIRNVSTVFSSNTSYPAEPYSSPHRTQLLSTTLTMLQDTNVPDSLQPIIQAAQLLQARKTDEDVQSVCDMCDKLSMFQVSDLCVCVCVFVCVCMYMYTVEPL